MPRASILRGKRCFKRHVSLTHLGFIEDALDRNAKPRHFLDLLDLISSLVGRKRPTFLRGNRNRLLHARSFVYSSTTLFQSSHQVAKAS